MEEVINHLKYIESQNEQIINLLTYKNIRGQLKILSYLENRDKYDFIDKTTKETYEDYLKKTGDIDMSITKFNRHIKSKFGLNIVHTNKDNMQVYIWRNKNETK